MIHSQPEIQAIVTDIEGTTSSIDFVHEKLFPYAAQQLPSYVRTHQQDANVAALLREVRQQMPDPESDLQQVIATLLQWIEHDNKATPLKTLQGLIWEQGYKTGAFSGHVYADVPRNLSKWRAQGIDLYVYSSGSVNAQKLLFAFSEAGDLTGLFKGYFDTQIGAKRELQSYRNIIQQLALRPQQILFLSDVVEELDAASKADMQTIQLVRNTPMPTGVHAIAHNFDEITF
jgi:enolase-phosphatase E1